MTTINQTSGLTSDDIARLSELYTSLEDAETALKSPDSLPEGVEAADLFEYIHVQLDALVDPSQYPDELWEDPEMIGRIADMKLINRGDPEKQYLIDALNSYLAEGGQATDDMNEAARIIFEMSDRLGDDGFKDATLSQIEAILAVIKYTFPALWLLFENTVHLQPIIREATDNLMFAYQDLTDEIQFVSDELGSLDPSSDQALIQENQIKLQNLQNVQRVYNQMFQTLNELPLNQLDAIGRVHDRFWRTANQRVAG